MQDLMNIKAVTVGLYKIELERGKRGERHYYMDIGKCGSKLIHISDSGNAI